MMPGWAFGTQLKTALWTPTAHAEVPEFESRLCCPLQPPANARSRKLQVMLPVLGSPHSTHVGDLAQVLGSWLWPAPTTALASL